MNTTKPETQCVRQAKELPLLKVNQCAWLWFGAHVDMHSCCTELKRDFSVSTGGGQSQSLMPAKFDQESMNK